MSRLLILMRHGESAFNAQNRFTGLADPPLTRKGVSEAGAAARAITGATLAVDTVFCSALIRTRQTADIIRAALPAPTTLVEDASLNERDYGELTGLDKNAAAVRWSTAQIRTWRRSYVEAPPGGESLRDTAARVLSFYVRRILPVIMRERAALVIAHGNSLRALVMTLDALAPAEVEKLELATGSLRFYCLAADSSIEKRGEISI